MRCRATFALTFGAFGCAAPTQDISDQAPAPFPPTLQAPICVRAREKAAIDASVLLSELQVITISCHSDDKYNTVVTHLRPALATKEEDLKAFFARAYGKRGQAEHDKYITELANLQSQLASRSGARFCSMNSSMMDQVMPLSTVEEMASYAETKRVQQALAVNECAATPSEADIKKASR
jgi:hypothetical protein